MIPQTSPASCCFSTRAPIQRVGALGMARGYHSSRAQVLLFLQILEIFRLRSFLRNCFKSGAWVHDSSKPPSEQHLVVLFFSAQSKDLTCQCHQQFWGEGWEWVRTAPHIFRRKNRGDINAIKIRLFSVLAEGKAIGSQSENTFMYPSSHGTWLFHVSFNLILEGGRGGGGRNLN